MPSNLPPILAYSLAFTANFKYPLVFVGAILEGPILMIASGFLLRLGYFSFWPLFISIFIGEMIGDLAWYYLGCWFADPLLAKHGKFIGVTREQYEKVKISFSSNPKKILILSKLTMGLGFAVAVLMVAGASRLKLRIFYLVNGLGELGFLSMMLAIGYFFGQLYDSIQGIFKYMFLGFSAVLILLALFGFSRYVKKNREKLL
jgi:membrane protein DedA with SNARE-associated domain